MECLFTINAECKIFLRLLLKFSHIKTLCACQIYVFAKENFTIVSKIAKRGVCIEAELYSNLNKRRVLVIDYHKKHGDTYSSDIFEDDI